MISMHHFQYCPSGEEEEEEEEIEKGERLGEGESCKRSIFCSLTFS